MMVLLCGGRHPFPVPLTAKLQDILDEFHVSVQVDSDPEQQPFYDNSQHQDGAGQQWIHYRPATEEKINHFITPNVFLNKKPM